MKLFVAATLSVFTLVASECSNTAEDRDSQATRQLQAQAQQVVGLPRITNFTEKRLATRLAELRDKPDLITYAYLQGIDGRLTCLGKAIGFGIPYSTQVTNPQQIPSGLHDGTALAQAEPNGLYMPESATATWLMLIGPDGKTSPTYVEPNITVSTIRLTGPAVALACPA